MSKAPSDETEAGLPSTPDGQEPVERVGYGRPPRHSQFKPGQSGNPRGRPRGARNTSTIVSEVLDRKITVTSEGRRKKMSVREAMITRTVEAGLRGDLKAMDFILKQDERFRQDSLAQGGVAGADAPGDMEDQAVIDGFLARVKPDPEPGA